MAEKSPKNLRSENERLRSEVEELRLRLDEAEQALEAIRTGQAESLIVEGPNGPRIFSLEGADHAYRVLVEAMNEGAATFGEDGTVLYCNARFAEMLGSPSERVMGSTVFRFLPHRSRETFEAMVREANGGESRGELELLSQDGEAVPAYVSLSVIHDETRRRLCLIAADLRAQKRNEQIVASERLARSVLEQAADAIVVCDENRRIIRASSSAVELCASNPLLEPFDDAVPLVLPGADERAPHESLLASAARGQVLRGIPAALIRRDGTRADLLVSATALHGSDHDILGFVVTLVDVTELRRTEEALRQTLADSEESEARFRSVLTDSRDVIYRFNIQMRRFEYISPSAEVVVGFSAEELTALDDETAQAMIHPDDAPAMRAALAQLEATGSAQVEYRQRTKNGDYRWLSNHMSLVKDSRGRPLFRNGNIRDTTQRRRAEDALRDSERRYKSLAENTPSVLMRYGPDLRVIFLSPSAEQITGRRSSDFIGKTNREMGMPEHLCDLWETKISEVFRLAVPREIEFTFATPSGDRCFLLKLVPEYGSDERVETVLGISTDITDRKRAEESIRAANLRLAEADKHRNQFLAVLSHELRNPLAPIKNSLFILDRAVPGGDQARRAQAVIDRQTGQLARLVDDLLDVTRITRNKIQLHRQRLELNDLVRRTIDDHRLEFEKQEISLELTPAPAPVYVNADWNRLAQVIGNLLQNAAKFTGRKGLTRVCVETDGARRAAVRVTDTGVGMTLQMISRLFEPFSQADDTLDRSKGGLGLGLALVKGLVDLHGGEVAARSEGLGKGSEFVVSLPLELPEVAQPEAPRQEVERVRRRVLIIEDNVDAAGSLSEALEFGDHEVAVAYNGPEGIAKAREFRPDVVLCDIGLPGMDGYDVARAIRADDALKGVFLVALTGYALPEDLQRAAGAGFERHLAKPPSLEKLERLLAEVPRVPSSDAATASPPPE